MENDFSLQGHSQPKEEAGDRLNEQAALPAISGTESVIAEAVAAARDRKIFLPVSDIPFKGIKSACAVALHMHQPLIPAGGGELKTAALISNLQYMRDSQDSSAGYNASVYQWCYKRMGEFVPQLLSEGKKPRIMLDYSGTLLFGLQQMGLQDVLASLKRLTQEPAYWPAVEWLGCPWGHAVAPSTPVQDFRLHVQAWQQHFTAIFGSAALQRVRGFSPAEMALPNHPDVAYEFVKTLRECGFQWVLLQEHTVEYPAGENRPGGKHLPHRLVCRNSQGQEASIIAIIKTQGSDTKLVGQLQPYYEAKGLNRVELGGIQVPPLVTQIADGENGGVMMNEFPPKYQEVVREATGTETVLMNVSEYLEHLFAGGVQEKNLAVIQPLYQKRIWERMQPGDGSRKLADVIAELTREDHSFHVDGGSWTNNISWTKSYQNVLAPLEKLSSLFYERVIATNSPTHEARYREALFYLLVSQTSCYRYWGQGVWTDYAQEICRRGTCAILRGYPEPERLRGEKIQ